MRITSGSVKYWPTLYKLYMGHMHVHLALLQCSGNTIAVNHRLGLYDYCYSIGCSVIN